MISLTRLDGHTLLVNEDLILFAERTPDTVLTFTTGLKLLVKESVDEVADRAAVFRADILARAWPASPDARRVEPKAERD